MRGGIDLGKHCFRPRVVGVVDIWKNSEAGMVPFPPGVALALCTSPSQSTIGRRGWVFHTTRGGIDPGYHRFRPRVVGVVYLWKDLLTGDITLSSQGGAGFILEPQPISDGPMGLRFPHRTGRCRPGGSPFSYPDCRSCKCMDGFLNRGWGTILPGCGGTEEFPRGQNCRRMRGAPSLAEGGRGGALGQWDWGSENAGM